jgi:hypothetical protein
MLRTILKTGVIVFPAFIACHLIKENNEKIKKYCPIVKFNNSKFPSPSSPPNTASKKE